MKYTPNIGDKRVNARIKKAYSYAVQTFSNHETMCSMEALSKRFGQQQTDLAKWLKQKLIICTDHHYSETAGISMKYILNQKGADEIATILGIKKTDIPAIVVAEYKDEFLSGVFNYKEQSNRYWHPIQNMRKNLKREVFKRNGYRHEYDIQAAAPTLLYQFALKHDCPPLPNIHEYIVDRESLRNKLSNELKCTPEQAKTIVNALFNKARIGVTDWSSLFIELGRDKILMHRIKNNEYINTLRDEINIMWKHLPVTDLRKGKERYAIYFALEKQVLDEIKKFLKKTRNKHFTEHDGWVCENEVETYRLHMHIKNKTGFSVNFSHETLYDL